MKMRRIQTVGDLKKYIKDLPDDMPVVTANDDHLEHRDNNLWDCSCSPDHWIELKYVKDHKIVQRPCKETSGGTKSLVF
jgi:mRNA-degrading endonuclease YafQ of YafQ-DinJ toxin-antitoxin module